jgi:hypothetical protein
MAVRSAHSVDEMKEKAGEKTGALWEKTKTKNPFRKEGPSICQCSVLYNLRGAWALWSPKWFCVCSLMAQSNLCC